MKNKVLIFFFCFLCISIFAQEKTKKELKAEKRLEKQKEMESLIDSQSFVFDAERVMPLGYRNIILDYNVYSLKFKSDSIICDLPFFGRGYNVGYGTADSGMKFNGKPEKTKIEKLKKFYSVKTIVKGSDDVYDIQISVYFGGSTTISINSNKRGAISYDGKIRPFNQEEK